MGDHFVNLSYRRNTQFIKNSKGDFPCFPSTIKQPYKSLIEECWRINPASRPEVKNILSLLLNKEEYFLSQLNEVANYKLSIANEHDDSEPIIHIESNFIEDITKIPQELRSVISMAEKGNPRCLYKIGKYLIEGKHNFDKDEKNGFYLIKKASNYHDMKAKYYCAKLYHTGTGFVNQNFKTSLELLEEVNCSEEKGNFQELQSLIQSIKDEMEGSNCSISEKYQYVKNRIMVMENLPKRTEEIEIRNTLSDYQIEAIDFITTGATSTGKKAYIIFYDEETLKEAFQNPYKIGKNTIKISLFKNKPCFKFKKSPKNKVKVKSSNLSKTINPKSSSNSSAQIPPEIDVSLITLPDGEKNYPFIGEGSYAVVFRAQYKGKTVAVKVTKDKFNSIEDKQKTLNYFRREVACLRVLNHPAVIKFYGHSYHNDIFGTNRNTLVMEYAPNSTLQNAIKMAQKGRPMKGWSNTKICNIIIGIANGMKTVHSAKILNRDLKPENILLDVNLYPKICDFGVAKTFDPNSDLNMTLLVGSPAYTAPEILDGSSRWYKKEADVYSFGIILYQLIVLESRPFANIRNVYQLSQYLNKNKRLNIPDSVHPFWKEMINNCWSGVISKRPTFSNIYESICNYLQTPENPPLFPDLNMEEVNAYINLLSANENKPTKTMSKSYQAGQLEKI
ncbi:hypothetical protein TRFO_25063 [Tritrichomonas foetus]|uniref:Protein kinase domain-containing protein n=1 Tax=Tritrichomonas foetus TaxID=1144522 RepID=A0A1J4KBM9_9EUKA|nr:hypothetical protein TRFO_25063 [Tritrichomonas foetus]|eukprot:OHT06877.1 hypothetical protein TRFO_25063 [Tritrichomonas foetus]